MQERSFNNISDGFNQFRLAVFLTPTGCKSLSELTNDGPAFSILERVYLEFENVCTSSSPIQHDLFLPDELLSRPPGHIDPPNIVKWEYDLAISFPEKHKTCILHFGDTASLSSSIQEALVQGPFVLALFPA